MKFSNSGFGTRMGIVGIAVCSLVFAMLQLPVASAEESGFIENRQCFGCHKSQKQAFQESIHGRAFESDAVTGCQSCHGGGAAHSEVAGQDNYTGPLKILSFKKGSGAPDEMTRPCLSCHQKDARRSHWTGSAHQRRDVACTSCHQIHTARDKVRDKRTQPEVCFACHKEQRAQANRASHHPIVEGKVACSNCHNPHGSSGPALLVEDTVNETCFSCHAEKRGPFLWEHAPVADNCTNCHASHGSSNTALLKQRPPYLCSSCHIRGHQAEAIRGGEDLGTPGTGIPNSRAKVPLVGKACLNCHGRIHGSNHPSGAAFAR